MPQGGRQVALLGDAELDEGAFWEAIVDPVVSQLGEVLWIVDLNRQSLDRIVPDIAAGRIAAMFEAAGWHTITVKYGRGCESCSRARAAPRCAAPDRRDAQRGVPAAAARRRAASCASGCPATDAAGRDLRRLVSELDDDELLRAIRDLGGHDLADLLDAFAEADAVTDRPSVIFAYTIKAWRLPTQGHPANHSALLTDEQWRARPRHSAPTRPIRGRGSTRTRPPRRAVRARPRGAGAPPADADRGPAAAGRPRPRARRPGLDPAGVRALLRRPRARRTGGRRRAS